MTAKNKKTGTHEILDAFAKLFLDSSSPGLFRDNKPTARGGRLLRASKLVFDEVLEYVQELHPDLDEAAAIKAATARAVQTLHAMARNAWKSLRVTEDGEVLGIGTPQAITWEYRGKPYYMHEPPPEDPADIPPIYMRYFRAKYEKKHGRHVPGAGMPSERETSGMVV